MEKRLAARSSYGQSSRIGRVIAILCVGILVSGLSAKAADGVASVVLVRTPSQGVQPQAIVDPAGVIHLVYLGGEAGASDVFYTTMEPGESAFGPSIRVNSEPGAAIAMGTVRGAHLAFGRDGRIHVAWNGSTKARPENPNGGSPMLYARSDSARTKFEPQRNVMIRSSALDGGGTIAADARGHVLITWHGRLKGTPEGEKERRMLVARSYDDGMTFDPEEPAWSQETGACACCGTGARADTDGSFTLIYRSAHTTMDRDLYILTSRDQGKTFHGRQLDPWKVGMCPMSTIALTEGADGLIAAWETQGEVFMAKIDRKTGQAKEPTHPSGLSGRRKHPAVETNLRGECLLAWTEDTSFTHGGSLYWRLFDSSGKPTSTSGRVADGIPHYSHPAVVARKDGGFLIIH